VTTVSRWIVHIMVFLFNIAGLDFGNVSPGGIEPFLIAGGLGDGEVGLIVPGPALRRKNMRDSARINVIDFFMSQRFWSWIYISPSTAHLHARPSRCSSLVKSHIQIHFLINWFSYNGTPGPLDGCRSHCSQ
jgi:hypothetical protein